MNSQWQSDMDIFMDKFFDAAMQDRFPGVAISIVKDGEIYSRACGYANREERRIVHPAETVFHVGSVSELMTAIAVMQVIERGQLRLTDPVARFLPKLDIPGTTPVTVAHLLTHTDGFEERTDEVVALNTADIRTPEEVLMTSLRSPVIRPGQMLTYNTWAMTIAGYLVEQLTDTPFVDYVEKNILQPLEMYSSTFQFHLPDDWKQRFATAYHSVGGSFEPIPFLYATSPATSGLSTTATNIAHLIIALLQNGHYGENRILQEVTTKDMFRQRFTSQRNLPGVTYGLMEFWEQDQWGFVCEGSGMGVCSRLLLLPEYNTGLFVVYNTPSDELPALLTNAYLKQFYPVPAADPKPAANFNYQANRFVGSYRYIQYNRHTIGKVQSLVTGTLQISNSHDGTLTIKPFGIGDGLGGFSGTTKLTPTNQSLIFQRLDTSGRVAFQEDTKGLITVLHSGGGYHSTYQKLPQHDTPTFQVALLGFCLFAFGTGALLWGIGTLTTAPAMRGASAWTAGLIGGVISILNLLFIFGVGFYLAKRIAGYLPYSVVNKPPRWLPTLFMVPTVNAFLTLMLILATMVAFQFGWYSLIERFHFLLLMVASVAFLIFLYRWNLFRYRV